MRIQPPQVRPVLRVLDVEFRVANDTATPSLVKMANQWVQISARLDDMPELNRSKYCAKQSFPTVDVAAAGDFINL